MRCAAPVAARPRGVSERTPMRMRTSRGRAYPHGARRPQQAGQVSTPAAKSASNRCSLSAIEKHHESIVHARRRTAFQTAGRPGGGGSCGNTYHRHIIGDGYD